MTLESTIRNLITESVTRKGTGRILSEQSGTREQFPQEFSKEIKKPAWYEVEVKQDVYTSPPAHSGEHPSTLSPEELALKKEFQRLHGTDKSLADFQAWKQSQGPRPKEEVQQIEKDRETLAQNRRRLDQTRPTGQPASFTPTGEAPKPGETATGEKVPQPGTPEFAARRQLEKIMSDREATRSAAQPQQPQKPPETPETKAASDAAETSSSVSNLRPAGGGLQSGSGLNVSTVQATQQSFTRQPLRASYDPMESRKNFIRESVLFCLKETNLRKSQRWQRKTKRTLEKIENKRDVLKQRIDALSGTPAGRVASYSLRLDRAELTPVHDAAVAAVAKATARVERATASGKARTSQREEDAAIRDAERRAERAWER